MSAVSPRWLLALVVAAAWPHGASAQIWRCETEGGVPLYQNTPGGKNCRPMNLPSLTTVPAPPPPPAAAPRSPASQAAASSTPSSFPRVDPATQRARDSDRRRILEDELKKEEQRMAELRREFNGGEPERRGDERNYQKYLDRVAQMKDELGRAEAAVASLRREMGTLKD